MLDLIIVIAIVFVIRVFLISPFKVEGSSMDHSLIDKDYIIVDQLVYRLSDYERGDIIVFRPPSKELYNQEGLICNFKKMKSFVFGQSTRNSCMVPEYYVKRIIGLPGDKVMIKNGKVFLDINSKDNFKELNESFYLKKQNQGFTCMSANCGTSKKNSDEKVVSEKESTFVVPDDGLFVLGDNRRASNDSRAWGDHFYVPFENVRGKVRVVLWPRVEFAPNVSIVEVNSLEVGKE